MQLATVGLLAVRDRKLLLAYSNNKQCFYLPGGKVDPGESATAALCREIAEELNIALTEEELDYYTHISAPAYGEQEGIIMEQDCFFVHRLLNPEASAEIGSLKYFSYADYQQETHRAPGAVLILKQLQADGIID